MVINVVDLLANITILCETAKYIAKIFAKKFVLLFSHPAFAACVLKFSARVLTLLPTGSERGCEEAFNHMLYEP